MKCADCGVSGAPYEMRPLPAEGVDLFCLKCIHKRALEWKAKMEEAQRELHALQSQASPAPLQQCSRSHACYLCGNAFVAGDTVYEAQWQDPPHAWYLVCAECREPWTRKDTAIAYRVALVPEKKS